MSRFKQDVPTLIGTGVVALSAAVLSFASLQALGERAGYSAGLAALLPLSIDAQAVVATRAWLVATTPPKVRRYARRLALSAVVSSVLGNAGEHAMTSAGVATPWWVVVLIAAIPPVALAATAHLSSLLATARVDTPQPGEVPTATPAVGSPDPVIEAGSTEAKSAPKVRKRAGSRHRSERSAPARARSLEQLRAEFNEAIASPSIEIDPTSAESIRRVLRCSPKRARQLRDEHVVPRLAVVGEQA